MINSFLYPDRFDELEEVEILSELELLNHSLINNVLKQVMSIRTGGYLAIANQHRLISTNNYKMSAESGKNITILPDLLTGNSVLGVNPSNIPDNLKGRFGFLLGGDRGEGEKKAEKNNLERFNFIGDFLDRLGSKLTSPHERNAVMGNETAAWTGLPWVNETTTPVSSIETLSYLADISYRLSTTLTTSRYNVGGGGNKAFGYFIGGINFPDSDSVRTNPVSKSIEKLNYLSNIVTLLGTELVNNRSCESSLKGDRSGLYLFGGVSSSWGVSSSTEKFDFLTETSTVLANVLGHNYIGQCSVGNERYLYLLGGRTQGQRATDGSNVITKFDMQSISIVPFSLSLLNTRGEALSLNSNLSGYIMGGWGGGSNQNPIPRRSILKMNLGIDENSLLLGVELGFPRANGGGISNYGETFS